VEGGSADWEWWQHLVPVRRLQTNVGAKIRNCIRNALEAHPPLPWAHEKLEWAISKDVYKGNASGPTKVCSDSTCLLQSVVTLLPDSQAQGEEGCFFFSFLFFSFFLGFFFLFATYLLLPLHCCCVTVLLLCHCHCTAQGNGGPGQVSFGDRHSGALPFVSTPSHP